MSALLCCLHERKDTGRPGFDMSVEKDLYRNVSEERAEHFRGICRVM